VKTGGIEIGMSTETPTRSRRWIWYFAALGLVAAILLTWLALFIRQQLDPANQLSLEQLRTARKLWNEKNLKDYQMLYTVKRGGEPGADTFFVEVRGGEVQSVLLNQKEWLPEDKRKYHSMTELLNNIEVFLKRDAQQDAPKTFCRGWFNSDDGHLVMFVRRVTGSREAVEIDVKQFTAK
jgi:hypothetical protein